MYHVNKLTLANWRHSQFRKIRTNRKYVQIGLRVNKTNKIFILEDNRRSPWWMHAKIYLKSPLIPTTQLIVPSFRNSFRLQTTFAISAINRLRYGCPSYNTKWVRWARAKYSYIFTFNEQKWCQCFSSFL